MSEHRVKMTINGRRCEAMVEGRVSLTDFLREEAGYTGVHAGCEHGACGSCTVILDGLAVRSCLMLAAQADGATITTVEGLADPGGKLHRVQQALMDEHGLQCGFCTPGVLMTLAALTGSGEPGNLQEVEAAMSGHLCRCTGYQGIRRAARRLATETAS
ncbi:MAG: (2Fe-2S)-binding protein [Blastomonas sp.]